MNWFCLCFVHVLILITCLLQMPSFAAAAEVLQVREADLLLIGDQNRTYSVRLACAEIQPGKEKAAIDFLRKTLPRRQRVNLMPIGSEEGLLLARVRALGSDSDLTTLLVEQQLATISSTCENKTS